MTTDKAKEILSRPFNMKGVPQDILEAHKMAIKALEQEPCEDAVSRDTALEKMSDYVASGYAESVKDFEEYSKIICQLPSVTLEPCEDCISRAEVMDNYNGVETPVGYRKVVDMEVIKNMRSVYPKAKVGKWIIDDKERNIIWHCHCSECNKDPQDYIGGTENWWLVRLPNNCPNCGARMEKEVKKNDKKRR